MCTEESHFDRMSHIYHCNQQDMGPPQGFKRGMKLEAVDKWNPSLTCVATVTDIMESRFLIHFDAWDDTYDYWCDAASNYIHPVGWCEENSKVLSPPNGKLVPVTLWSLDHIPLIMIQ